MRRFCSHIIFIMVLCTSGLVLTRSIGSHLPWPQALTVLHLTDCALPCWAGIVPGQTTLDEASSNRIMNTLFPNSVFNVQQGTASPVAIDFLVTRRGIIPPQWISLTFYLARDGKTVRSIAMMGPIPRNMSELPAVGDLALAYSLPGCYALSFDDLSYRVFTYQNEQQQPIAQILLHNAYWTSNVETFLISDPEPQKMPCAHPEQTIWRGLASDKAYHRLAGPIKTSTP